MDGVNVALGLGVADVCCRSGKVSKCTRPLHQWHIPKSIQFGVKSSCETIVFPNGTVFLVDGVYVALGLGVADVCCRFGKVPVAFVPSIAIWSPKLCFAPSTQNANSVKEGVKQFCKDTERKRCGAPPHPFPPNPFAVRGRPGALALQLVSSSSRTGSH